MAKKQKAEAAPGVDLALVGLDWNQDGTYEYRDIGHTRERAVTVDGARFEHCANDQHGRWLYRHAHQ